jgi:hypothetical protein
VTPPTHAMPLASVTRTQSVASRPISVLDERQ